MSAHLRQADFSPPQASLFFWGKFDNFLIKKKPSGLLGLLLLGYCAWRRVGQAHDEW
jgi:hypothetical protein